MSLQKTRQIYDVPFVIIWAKIDGARYNDTALYSAFIYCALNDKSYFMERFKMPFMSL